MPRIAILPPAVQGQIAAGEVIERPASVVKELVENALDAGAARVDVQLAGGGLDAIIVQDDGHGMDGDDAALAFARHATSKLVRAEELPGIATLGFRGEALPSIAAVARVRVTTRTAAASAAAVVEADEHGVRVAGLAGAAPGTTIDVRDLFGAMPARRKFLRTPTTEVGHVVDVLTRLAVASPTVGFRLTHDGRQVLALPAVRELRQRAAQVLGHERAASLASFEVARGGAVVSGLLAPPRSTVGSARLIWTYVAIGPHAVGRWVRDRLLLRAVLDGYESLLMRGRYPVVIVTLRLPAGEVDVNVHPAKLEVRFHRPAAIHQLIVPALRTRLAAGLAPGSVPAAVGGDALRAQVAEAAPVYGVAGAAGGPAAHPEASPAPMAGAAQAGLWATVPSGFRSLRFVGQLFDGYLLCEGAGQVVLIDQHAAHERVVFERLRAEHARGEMEVDRLLVPETVAVPPVHAAALVEHAGALAGAGLEGEPFGDGTFLLRTVPRLLRGRDVGAVVRALAEELAEHGASEATTRAVDAVLATVACHSVVRVGQRLEAPQVRALLDSMDSVEISAHCPHGRPVAAELTRAQLEALFRR